MRKIIHTVGNMVKIPPTKEISCHTESFKLIFVGKMSYEPNIVAVTYFVNDVFPTLSKGFPSLEFIIIGANPDERIQRLATISGITITGFVESLVPYFMNATIVVAPMLTGAGIQNKIIQAMSHGCCVATTTTGAEGLSINHQEIAIFNTTEEWITGINHLLNDRPQRMNMGKLARKYVIDHLSPQIISRQFWTFIKAGGIDGLK